MDYDTFFKLVKEYDEMGGGILHITGGEPTTVKYFEKYLKLASIFKNVDFNLNTNLYSKPISKLPFENIKRLKVSLDTSDPNYFDHICGIKNSFRNVTENLDYIHNWYNNIIVSLTCTITKETYTQVLDLLDLYYERWPNFYAIFFSTYKGTNPKFILDKNDIDRFFNQIVPEMNEKCDLNNDNESKMLFANSVTPIVFGSDIRFPENEIVPCYLQLSELCIDQDGCVWNCSHLYRDKIPCIDMHIQNSHLRDIFKVAKSSIEKYPLHPKCLYGCNKKLAAYNNMIYNHLNKS
jgi:MoaA/NifB/PqqE/SkfB family radical SAM enzyme